MLCSARIVCILLTFLFKTTRDNMTVHPFTNAIFVVAVLLFALLVKKWISEEIKLNLKLKNTYFKLYFRSFSYSLQNDEKWDS